MIQDLMEAARRDARQVLGERATTRIGIVDGYDPTNYAARVRLQPEDVATGWLPIMAPQVGNGFGVYAPPNIGDQVVVAFQEGGHEAGIVLGSLYSAEDRPLEVPAGQVWIVSQAGLALRIAEDRLEIVAPGGVAITGNVTVNGAVTATDDVKAGSISLKTHRHANSGGTGTGGAPVP